MIIETIEATAQRRDQPGKAQVETKQGSLKGVKLIYC